MERAELKELIREILNEVIEEHIQGKNLVPRKPLLSREEYEDTVIRECPIVVTTSRGQCESVYRWCRENISQFAFRAYPIASGDWAFGIDKYTWRFRHQSHADALIKALAEGAITSGYECV